MKSLTSRKHVLSSLAFLLAGPAIAAQAPPVIGFFDAGKTQCWAREYDIGHMAAHPRQLVNEITFSYFPTLPFIRQEDGTLQPFWHDFDGAVSFSPLVRVQFRDSDRQYENTAICMSQGDENTKPGQILCGMECDGGQFTIERDIDGSLVLRNRGFVVTPCGEPDEGEDEARVVDPADDHDIFRLYPVAAENCIMPSPPDDISSTQPKP